MLIARLSRVVYQSVVVCALFVLLLAFLSGCQGPPMLSQAEAYTERALAALKEDDVATATAALDKAFALNPDLPRAYYVRAMIHRYQKELPAALADLEQAKTLDPNYLEVYIGLGMTYQRMGDLAKTVTNYQKALQLSPDNADLYNDLCWAYGVFNQPDDALDYCERAVELRAEPYIHDSRGLVYALLGDYGNAIIDFTIFVNSYEKKYKGHVFPEVEQRKAWIKAMQAGQNPFNEALLEELRTK